MRPRLHQREALQAIRNHQGDRALVVMACGTGKTLVGRHASLERSASVVLVVVPTLALAEQTYQRWVEDCPGELEVLFVCADVTIGGTGTPVTVDPEQIADFLSSGRGAGTRLLISTYHSAERIAEAYALRPLPMLDFAIFDEAHHTAGRTGKAFSVVLDNARIPVRFRLSLTATPVVHKSSDGTTDVVSMDDDQSYGKRVHELTFGQGIQRKLLADYEVAIVLVSDQDVHKALLSNGALQTGPGFGDAATMAAQIAVARAMRQYDLHRILAFHSRVAHSKRFSATLGTVGAATAEVEITSLHTDGGTPSSERLAQLQTLAHPEPGRRVVLNNCRTLTEGVDISSVDGICLVDPKSSETDIIQAVGRALRLHPERDRPALILLPVYLAPGENPQAVLEASSFRHVWRVLTTLRDQDERMDAALTSARRRLSAGEHETTDARPVLPERVKLYGGTDIDARFAHALAVHVLERTTEDWYHVYGLLERYAAEHGHAAVPTSPTAGTLGSWTARQRGLYASGRLLPKRAALLEALPGWTWRLAVQKRERGLTELEDFVAEHGHAQVPRGYASPKSGYRLDSFVTLARNRYRADQMEAEEVAYYEALPGWMWHVHDAKFERFLRLLDAYIAENRHARVPQTYSVEVHGKAVALGHAVSVKRTAYRKGTVPDWQVEALEKRPEWVWDGMAALWEASFEILAAWAAEHGDIKVPFDQAINGVVIYRWMLQQKKLIRQGKLPNDRRSRLESLPGWTKD
ncbi:Helicase associated domain protein [Streptomyces europaeiscabiei]|uniref:DEAD/DEAH box helicase n=1 Tax=Streptomyces europaeiscabiei TaxID=146819 RepID=UPI0029A817A8|nr:Helicase associated domain protein [Streptomyces europaeiscabiei]MDX3694700.1 Helicase associated domain protein [Streptomyces europaeiscabiei]